MNVLALGAAPISASASDVIGAQWQPVHQESTQGFGVDSKKPSTTDRHWRLFGIKLILNQPRTCAIKMIMCTKKCKYHLICSNFKKIANFSISICQYLYWIWVICLHLPIVTAHYRLTNDLPKLRLSKIYIVSITELQKFTLITNPRNRLRLAATRWWMMMWDGRSGLANLPIRTGHTDPAAGGAPFISMSSM